MLILRLLVFFVNKGQADRKGSANASTKATSKLSQNKLYMSGNMGDLYGLLSSLAFQFLIGIFCILGFGFLRRQNQVIFSPNYSRLSSYKPTNNNFWGWISPLFQTNELLLIHDLGLEGIMFLRFAFYCFKYFLYLSIFSIPLMTFHFYSNPNPNFWKAPMEAPGTAGASPGGAHTLLAPLSSSSLQGNASKTQEKEIYDTNQYISINPSLASLTIANVSYKASSTFFIHIGFCWIYTGLAYYLFYQLWQEYHLLRRQVKTCPEYQKSRHTRTLLLVNVPKSMRNFKALMFRMRFDYIPTAMIFGREYLELPSLIEKHAHLIRDLEGVLFDYLQNNLRNSRPNHFDGLPLLSEPIDTIDDNCMELDILARRIYTATSRGEKSFRFNSSCFVEFQNSYQANWVVSRSGRKTFDRWRLPLPDVKLSPDLSDVIWASLSLSKRQKRIRRLTAFAMLFAVFCGWLILQGVITALSSIQTWRGFSAKVADTIEKSQVLIILVQSLLTPLLMALMNYLLPLILRAISIYQGIVSYSGVERSTLLKYFCFQVIMVIMHIGYSIIPSVLISLANGQSSSIPVFLILLVALLRNFVSLSTTYIYFMLAGFTYFGLEILQAYNIVVSLVYRFFTLPPRAQRELNQPPAPEWQIYYGYLLFIFLIGSCYSIISPLIVIFSCLVFTLGYYCMKYQILYVYREKILFGSVWWPKIFNYLCFSIIMSQLVTCGTILVAHARSLEGYTVNPTTVFLMLPLPLLTYGYWRYCVVFLLLESEYIPDEFENREIDPQVLDRKHFNPKLFAPLEKVQLPDDMDIYLPSLYTPEFKDQDDFLQHLSGKVSK